MKLVKCPKCGAEINYLVNWQSTLTKHLFDGSDYSKQDEEITDGVNDYQCPRCDKVLFTNDEDARKFLRGES